MSYKFTFRMDNYYGLGINNKNLLIINILFL